MSTRTEVTWTTPDREYRAVKLIEVDESGKDVPTVAEYFEIQRKVGSLYETIEQTNNLENAIEKYTKVLLG